MSQPTCDHPACQRPSRARGLCSTHYNQTFPNRHRPHSATCVACGADVSRSSGGGGRKYGATCSTKCRRDVTYGERCELPTDHWARWYGASSPVDFRIVTCGWCGTNFATKYSVHKLCSDRCKNARKDARRTARTHLAEGEYRWSQVADLWRALDKRCAYCLEHLPLTRMQVEHVTPLSRGGRNDLSNILPACGPCNADKGDRTPAEWDTDRISLRLPPRAHHITTHDTRFAHLVTLDPRGLPYRLRLAA